MNKIIAFFKGLDGNKTYILTVIGGIFVIVHFISVGDFSLTALASISQDTTILAAIAALRHGVQKSQDAQTKA